LAKKGNGCLPPGQAKRPWVVGQPLPPAVVYYPVPPVLVQQLEPLPPGYEYVRVDNDVLLIEMVNRMVADVIDGLNQPD
jgi:Ni/Co efflux regulator RcnB